MGWRTLVRNGLLAGLVATTAMNASYWAERRIRRNVDGPLDYDDSNVPVLVAAKILRQSDLSDEASFRLGLAVHWGYGSLFGVGLVPLGQRLGLVRATGLYWAGMMAMACVMFPVLGDTPPPWRWRNDVIMTSMFQHLIYATSAAATLHWLTRPRPDDKGQAEEQPIGDTAAEGAA